MAVSREMSITYLHRRFNRLYLPALRGGVSERDGGTRRLPLAGAQTPAAGAGTRRRIPGAPAARASQLCRYTMEGGGKKSTLNTTEEESVVSCTKAIASSRRFVSHFRRVRN